MKTDFAMLRKTSIKNRTLFGISWNVSFSRILKDWKEIPAIISTVNSSKKPADSSKGNVQFFLI